MIDWIALEVGRAIVWYIMLVIALCCVAAPIGMVRDAFLKMKQR